MADSSDVLTVSVIGLKGGVGKTTVTLGLAGAAQARQLRTLVVDLDPQANATAVLDPPEVRLTANDVLADPTATSVRDAVASTTWGKQCDLLASEPALIRRDHIPDGKAGEHRLRSAISGALDGYALTLVDCPPSLGQLTANALAASDLAVVVAEPTLFALTGTQRTVAAADAVRQKFNLRLRTAGIVVNRFDVRSAEHRYRVDELIHAYRDLVLDPPIPQRSAINQAHGGGYPIQRWPSASARKVAPIFDAHLSHLLRTAGVPLSQLTRGRAS